MKIEEREELIKRASKAKKTLVKKGYRQLVPIFTWLYPPYNTRLGKTRVSNVLLGRQPHKEITEKLEDMADQVNGKSQ